MTGRRLTELEKQQIAAAALAEYSRENPGARAPTITVGDVTHPNGQPQITIEPRRAMGRHTSENECRAAYPPGRTQEHRVSGHVSSLGG